MAVGVQQFLLSMFLGREEGVSSSRRIHHNNHKKHPHEAPSVEKGVEGHPSSTRESCLAQREGALS